jgi:hypothetical protein
MGSLIDIVPSFDYQLDLITPGSRPSDARFRKQIRQMPNFRRNALGRPHMGHRLYARTRNFAFPAAFCLSAFFAKPLPP